MERFITANAGLDQQPMLNAADVVRLWRQPDDSQVEIVPAVAWDLGGLAAEWGPPWTTTAAEAKTYFNVPVESCRLFIAIERGDQAARTRSNNQIRNPTYVIETAVRQDSLAALTRGLGRRNLAAATELLAATVMALEEANAPASTISSVRAAYAAALIAAQEIERIPCQNLFICASC